MSIYWSFIFPGEKLVYTHFSGGGGKWVCKTGTTVEDYATVYSDIPTSDSITDGNIVQDIISARDIEIDDTSDQEDDTTSAPVKRPMEEVLAACDVIRDQLECSENPETALMQFNVVTRFLMKQHLKFLRLHK
jgi:hypothetical protein